MKKKTLILTGALACALPLMAVNPGENLLNNPTFETGANGLPVNWERSYETQLGFITTGVEDGKRHVAFLPGAPDSFGIGQGEMKLVPGGKYRFGAWVRTRNLKIRRADIVFMNWAWANEFSLKVPRDTNGEWRKVEMSVTAFDSFHSVYSWRLYAVGMTDGEFAIREPFLVAEDAAAAATAERAPVTFDPRQITPVAPLLKRIPAGDSPLTLVCAARNEPTVCAVYVTLGNEAERLVGRFPLAGERVHGALTRMTAGAGGRLRLVLETKDGAVAEQAYPIRVLQDVKVSHPAERQLNGVVTRLRTAPAADGTVAFSAPDDGWIWISLSQGGERTKVFLDDGAKPVMRFRPGERFETLRRVTKGDHVLRVEGATGGELIVNAVPELYCDSYPAKYLKGYAFVTDEFRAKYVYSAFATYNYGYGLTTVPKAEWDDFADRGKELYGMMMFPQRFWGKNWKNRYETVGEMTERMRKSLSNEGCAEYAGRSFDEVYIPSVTEPTLIAKTLRAAGETDKPLYVWSSGYTFRDAPDHAEFLSACVNNCEGRGRYLFECYPYYNAEGETGLERYLDGLLDDSIRRAQRIVPGVNRNAFIVMGLYTRQGRYNYDALCVNDTKRLIDRYIQRLAVRGDFAGLGGFGLYAWAAGEEEDVRWVSKAVRHYLLEGRTESLSDRYGYVWCPEHIRNGDFREKLSGWTSEPAAGGEIRPENVPGYGNKVQRRDQGGKNGDDVCVMRRSSAGPNRISTMLTGLTPGALYSVRYVVAPLKAAKENKADERRYAFSAAVEGADDVTASMPVARYGGPVDIRAKTNQHTLVFRAKGATARLVLSDWESAASPGGEPGEELVVNAVRVRPYFAE